MVRGIDTPTLLGSEGNPLPLDAMAGDGTLNSGGEVSGTLEERDEHVLIRSAWSSEGRTGRQPRNLPWRGDGGGGWSLNRVLEKTHVISTKREEAR